MKYLKNEELLNHVKNIISEKHQLHERELHLTVSKVSKIQNKGAIDFGGSEEKEVNKTQLEPIKINPEDKYGWWKLDQGNYIIEVNEKIQLKEDLFAITTALPRTIKAGGTLISNIITSNENKIILSLTTSSGINIKENARIAKLLILKM